MKRWQLDKPRAVFTRSEYAALGPSRLAVGHADLHETLPSADAQGSFDQEPRYQQLLSISVL